MERSAFGARPLGTAAFFAPTFRLPASPCACPTTEAMARGVAMYTWKTSLKLNAPRAKVWSTIIDFANVGAWNPRVDSGTMETDGSVGQGTRVRWKRGSRVTIATVEEWAPPRLLRLHISRGKTNGSVSYSLANAPDGGTQLDHVLELDPPLWLEPLMLFAGFGNKRELSALKAFVEKGGE